MKDKLLKENLYLLKLLEGKWKILIIEDLFATKVRQFCELKTDITGISAKVLNDNLVFLVKNHIISKRSYFGFPPKVEYSLTATGKDMRSILDTIYQWSIEHYEPPTETVEDEYFKIFTDDSNF